MDIKRVFKEQLELVKPSENEIKVLKKKTNEFIKFLNAELKSAGHGGEVFIGGSFAKNTMIKGNYDIDVLVRFSWEYDDLSILLEKPLRSLAKKNKWNLEKIHGSRDYFRVYFSDSDYFEVIPVTKIKKPKEAKNVTDLTYFHVPYIKKKIGKLNGDIILAKTFCQAQKVYGAETYVRGFSGYALELLVIYYKGFEKMLKQLVKIKKGDRIIVDSGKHYKKNDAFFELNEAKLSSPVIVVDPTYKERNALAALSKETFEKFQDSAKRFLKSPSKRFFVEEKIDVDKLKDLAKKNKAEFIHVKLKTDRQAGDIAGTKLKKFHYFVEKEIKKYFELLKHEFEYDNRQSADFYMVVKSKGEIVQIGPPMQTKKLRKHIQAFKEAHRGNTLVKNNVLHAKIKVDFTGKEFLDKINRDKDNLNEMGITEMNVE